VLQILTNVGHMNAAMGVVVWFIEWLPKNHSLMKLCITTFCTLTIPAIEDCMLHLREFSFLTSYSCGTLYCAMNTYMEWMTRFTYKSTLVRVTWHNCWNAERNMQILQYRVYHHLGNISAILQCHPERSHVQTCRELLPATDSSKYMHNQQTRAS
jgi:hypothetical protein